MEAYVAGVTAKNFSNARRLLLAALFICVSLLSLHSQAQSCSGVADIWFANDESAGVSDSQVRDSLDFLYQVVDEFVYDNASGVVASVFGWSDTIVNATAELNSGFFDGDDGGLFDPNFDGSEIDKSIFIDQDTQGIREFYRQRLSSGGSTDLPAATAALTQRINTDSKVRAYAPQVAVIVTNAVGADLSAAAWDAEIASLEAVGPNGAHVVIVLVDDAANDYTNNIAGAMTAVDNIIANYNTTLVVAAAYEDVANPANGHVASTVSAICNESALSLKVLNSSGTFSSILPIDSFTLDFQFGEDVTGFDISDIVATGANLSDFVTNSADNYGVLVSASSSADINVSVAAGVAISSGGDPNTPLDLIIEFDSDADGIGNLTEGILTVPSRNSDDDLSIADHLDLDSDNDGIPDKIESGSTINQPVDTDFDGVPDYLDLDSDNDGIPDLIESGIPYNDILTIYDLDGDGRIDAGVVVGADGLVDDLQGGVNGGAITYTVLDTDGDGIKDFRDRDSDGDGIFDLIQSGVPYNRIVALDLDRNGAIDSPAQLPGNVFGDDGILNEIQGGIDGGPLDVYLLDTDSDGTIDSLDDDADNDTIPDLVEVGDDPQNARDSDTDGVPDISDRDSDNDRMPDRLEAGANPLVPVDSEGDGIPDYIDTDSDNDTVLDIFEQGSIDQLSGIDVVGDLGVNVGNGIDDNIDVAVTIGNDVNGNFIDDDFEPSNFDGDALPDYLDLDSDGDSILDILEENNAPELTGVDSDSDGIDDLLDVNAVGGADLNNNGIADRFEPANTDKDQEPDFRDLDSDNDGIPDEVESVSVVLTGNDTDIDGIDDGIDVSIVGGLDENTNGIVDAAEPPDTDSDGAADYVDLDSDNDSLPDVQEVGLPDFNQDAQVDSPADEGSILTPLDTDADGIADYLDLESEDATNDGVAPFDLETNTTPGLDLAVLDVAPIDGEIDTTFADVDGDGISESDGFIGGPDFFGGFGTILDSDFDLIENAIDLDDDNDRIPDAAEGDGTVDTDADGIPDLLDFDSDNDGIYDTYEAYGTVAEANGLFAAFDDANGDGLDDEVVVPFVAPDTDGDGVADFRDLDSDNDTLFDLFESAATINAFLVADADENGIVDSINPLNGVPNTKFVPIDSDGDGVDNYRDLDSDNDGFSDQLESGDGNGNGIDDSSESGSGEFKATTGGAGSIGLPTLLLSLIIVLVQKIQLRSFINRVSVSRFTFFPLILFVSTLGFPGVSTAKTDCGYDRETEPEFQDCWYIGLGGGVSSIDPQDSSNGWSVEDDSSNVWELLIGKYFLNRWFAELKYGNLGAAELRHSNLAVDAKFPDASISYEAISAAAGYYFFDENNPFNTYLKAGIASLKVTSKDNGNTVRLDDNTGIKGSLSIGATFRRKDSPWLFRLFYESYSKNVSYSGLSIVRYIGGKDRSRSVDHGKNNNWLSDKRLTNENQLTGSSDVDSQSDTASSSDVLTVSDDTQNAGDQKVSAGEVCFGSQGIIERIYFSMGVYGISDQDEELLLSYVPSFHQYKNAVIEIAGHHDVNEFSKDTEGDLGLLRAKRVADFLADYGVSREQLKVANYAATKPIIPSRSGKPNALNARVEFSVSTVAACE